MDATAISPIILAVISIAAFLIYHLASPLKSPFSNLNCISVGALAALCSLPPGMPVLRNQPSSPRPPRLSLPVCVKGFYNQF